MFGICLEKIILDFRNSELVTGDWRAPLRDQKTADCDGNR